MKSKFNRFLFVSVASTVSGITHLQGATPLPAWDGQPGTTRAGYTFSSNSLNPAPTILANPFGTPLATVTVGGFGVGWYGGLLPGNPSYDLTGVDHDGAWDLGRTPGTIAVTVPFAPTAPVAGLYYDVKLQVYAVAWRDINQLPTLAATETLAAPLTITSGLVNVPNDNLPGEWDFRQWTGSFTNVTSASTTFTLVSHPTLGSVVDTYEIFTQYAWKSDDPLARIWNGNDVDDDLWTSPDNWSGIAPVAGDTLYFAGTTRLTPDNNMAAGTSFGGINFLSDAGAFTLGGNGITLNGGVTNFSSNLQTIALPVTLSGQQTITTNGAAGGISISGAIGGAGGIDKAGPGTLTLTAGNGYSGNTQVGTGTLALSGAGAIASSPLVSVISGANLDVSAVNGGIWTVPATQTLTGGGTVIGNTLVEGTHAPGDGIGSATMTGDINYAAGSVFEWQMSTSFGSEGSRGLDYDSVDISGALGGGGAVFRVILNGTETFDDAFWDVDRLWSDIFLTASADPLGSIFTSFAFANASGDLATPFPGSFSFSGGSLVWSAVPEPRNSVIGLLMVSVLLRRRRSSLLPMVASPASTQASKAS